MKAAKTKLRGVGVVVSGGVVDIADCAALARMV
jgi:hypothetical protein